MTKHTPPLILLLALLLLVPVTNITGQDDGLVPIYSPSPFDSVHRIQTLYWASDSQSFGFNLISTGSYFTDPWIVYGRQTTMTTELAPLTLLQTLAPTVSLSDVNPALVFPSPDHRFVVSATSNTITEQQVIIVDTSDNRAIETGINPGRIDQVPQLFTVTWSDDATSLTVATSSRIDTEPSSFRWVTNFAEDSAALDVREITFFTVEERQYTTLEVYDISADGQNVLLRTFHGQQETDAFRIVYPLVIWNSAGQHRVINGVLGPYIDHGEIRAAVFAPENENELLVVDRRGLLRYSLETGAITILRPDITSERFRFAHFSPDGEQLALVEQGIDQPLHMLDLAAVLANH